MSTQNDGNFGAQSAMGWLIAPLAILVALLADFGLDFGLGLEMNDLEPYAVIAIAAVLGANIGTTVTALLAAITGTVSALVAAFSHLLFNISGIVIIYCIPALRNIPLKCAEIISEQAATKKYLPLLYLFCIFVLLPLFIIYFGR